MYSSGEYVQLFRATMIRCTMQGDGKSLTSVPNIKCQYRYFQFEFFCEDRLSDSQLLIL